MKKLIIFDLDGTLIDSVYDLASAINYMLHCLSRNTFSEDTIRYWVGNGANILVRRALSGSSTIDDSLDNELVDEASHIFLDYYSKHLSKETKIYPNVKETLVSLKDRGYRLAVVTNKPISFVSPILDDLGLDNIFEFYLGGDSLDEKKPSPKPLLYLCDKLNIDTKDTLMVGDSKNDILSANRASIDSIGVTYGYNYAESIDNYNPTFVIDNFAEILDVIEVY